MTNSEARKRNQAAQTPQQPHQQPNSPALDSGAIGRLTEAERAALVDAFRSSSRSPEHLAFLAESAVEAIVREHVTAALAEVESRIDEQIADLPEHREEWAHGAITALRSIQRVVIERREGAGR